MTAYTALALLKYLSLVLATASTVVSLLTRTTYEDEAKRKHLTVFGMALLGIIIVSALTSAISFGFDAVLSQGEARTRQQEKVEAKMIESSRQALELRRDLTRRSEAADIRSRITDQRVLQLTVAAEERDRAEKTARLVEEGAKSNLSRTETALDQINRVLHPINDITVSALWSLAEPLPIGGDVRKAILTRRAQASCGNAAGGKLLKSSVLLDGAEIDVDCLRLLAGAVNLGIAIRNTTVRMTIFSSRSISGSEQLRVGTSAKRGEIGRDAGDLDLSNDSRPKVAFFHENGGMSFGTIKSLTQNEIAKSGRIVSLPDLEGAKIVVCSGYYSGETKGGNREVFLALKERFELSQLQLVLGGKTLTFDRGQIHRKQWDDDVCYVVESIHVN